VRRAFSDDARRDSVDMDTEKGMINTKHSNRTRLAWLSLLPLLIAVAGLWLYDGASLVQSADLRAPDAIAFDGNKSSSTTPGNTVTYDHTLTNTFTQSVTVTLTAISSRGYSTSITPGATLEILAGSSRNISVSIVIPSGAATGTDVTTVRAQWNGQSAEVQDTTTINEAPATATPTATFTATPVATATQTPTPTYTPDTNVYADRLEPNNTLQTASELVPNAARTCNLTLWPTGDIDYFRFQARNGRTYNIFTLIQVAGLDTYLTVYDPRGNVVATNDDDPTNTTSPRSSRIEFTAGENGVYYASVINLDASNPANKTYCIELRETTPAATPTPSVTPTPSSTPTPTATATPAGDRCEPNDTFADACLIEVGRTETFNFQPARGVGLDRDYFRFWIKPGLLYTCITGVSGFTDTVMTLFDQEARWLGSNDDRAVDDFGSEVSYFSRYTGYLYVLVEPLVAPDEDKAASYTYSLTCSTAAPTETPVPTETPEPTETPVPTETPASVPTARPDNSGGGNIAPTAVPRPVQPPVVVVPTQPVVEETPTPFVLPTNTPLPVVSVRPLPTATPVMPVAANYSLDVLLYYDENGNFMPELNEGIVDMAVVLFDNSTGRLLAFGYTNQAGMVLFDSLNVTGAVRVSVPFLNFNQILPASTRDLQLRIPPNQLPAAIP
jgi:type VI secretion system secreted protein VgrG